MSLLMSTEKEKRHEYYLNHKEKWQLTPEEQKQKLNKRKENGGLLNDE